MPRFINRITGKGVVGFAPTLVTGVSRPLTRKENNKIHDFEAHASRCNKCHRPHSVYRKGRRLCRDGHELAGHIADLLFRLRSNGDIVSWSEDEQQEIRVELPTHYTNTISLFKAMKETGKSIIDEPVSYDSTYFVQARPRRSRSVPDTRRHSTRSQIVVEPSSKRRSSKNHRGSLYPEDARDQEQRDRRERKMQYDITPAHWTGYYR